MNRSKLTNQEILKLTPHINEGIILNQNNEDKITIQIPHPRSKLNLFSKKQKYSTLELDPIGTYVIQQIDGQKTIQEIITLKTDKFKNEEKDIDHTKNMLLYLNFLEHEKKIITLR